MSFAEVPVLTDAEEIKQQNTDILAELAMVKDRQDKLVEGVNAIGQNVQWIVDNVQNVFAVLGNPALMSQMMGQVMGGAVNGGQDAGTE